MVLLIPSSIENTVNLLVNKQITYTNNPNHTLLDTHPLVQLHLFIKACRSGGPISASFI